MHEVQSHTCSFVIMSFFIGHFVGDDSFCAFEMGFHRALARSEGRRGESSTIFPKFIGTIICMRFWKFKYKLTWSNKSIWLAEFMKYIGLPNFSSACPILCFDIQLACTLTLIIDSLHNNNYNLKSLLYEQIHRNYKL